MAAPVSRTTSSPARSKGSLVPQDKGAVILDIGRVYTRLGLSGEPAPRHIIKSNVLMKPYGEVLDIWDDKYINREELYLMMCRFLHKIFLEYLMINPREYRVVIVESIVAPLNFRNTLAKALFSHFSVPHVCCLPHHLACLYTLGSSTALVIDIGLKEISVVPVYEGVPLIKSVIHTTTATASLYSSLQALMLEHGKVEDAISGDIHPLSSSGGFSFITTVGLTSSLLADIIVKTCFVRPLSRGDAVPPDVRYPVNGQFTLLIPGLVRCRSADVLYEGSTGDLGLPVCVLESLLLCPIDCRVQLCQNVIIVGGSADLPGLNFRLKEEIKCLYHENQYQCLKSLNFKFHKLLSHPNYTAWQGASIIGALEAAIMERSVTREDFKSSHHRLPDWMSCSSQDWESLRQISPRKLTSPAQQRRPRQTSSMSEKQ